MYQITFLLTTLIIHFSFPKSTLTAIVIRNISYRKKGTFHDVVLEIDWGTLYVSGNTQESFTWIHSNLINLFNKHFPKRTVKKIAIKTNK